ncbi:hypothetical protein LCI18_007227 [Fusarium solani-melongenae]|uniref:Uncharacterized protein n=1 Tax=Fusarium solani subsp. cucurbitae TaxID=2747967 RepID=A0ACD3Z5A3_FUSSC|nr:hypothetical protein LCI18_007227 [Fusarium solani-melongenae]
MKTWFLPPDFTFTPDGPLQLGAVITHPGRPTNVLASPRTDPSIQLPEIQVITEKNHTHSNEVSRKGGVSLFAKFVEFASGSVSYEASRRNLLQYGNVDHEVRSLLAPFSKDFLTSLTSLDSVKEHIDSGLVGKRPVYLVSGLRVTNESFTVTKEKGIGNQAEISASGPTGPVPVEVGGSLSGGVERTKLDSYETAPGIVFAYRLHVIRVKKSTQSEMFSSSAALWTGREEPEPEPMEVLDVTLDVVGDDLEEDEIRFGQADLENGDCYLHQS